ncbi:Altered inheritance of mitochondria protein 6 [Neonectria punicea]|uniref:Altered inheritance of mitochondria protein 6 n=1 Tax=Neonectria punicea TaxID=979145 RepID=A0ABR1GPX6_9HYPO
MSYPLFKILQAKNPVKDATTPTIPVRGIYDIDPNQTLVLLVDIKANPEIAWPLLLEQLQPLRTLGWLSHTKNGTLFMGPVTVVDTGTTQVEQVEANPARDVFLDAPLAKLDGDAYTSTNSYYASVSFRRSIGLIGPSGLRNSQLLKVRDEIQKAHSRGLKVRYWSLSAWPLSKQSRLWEGLVSEGLDILHIDDLLGAREVLTRRNRNCIVSAS